MKSSNKEKDYDFGGRGFLSSQILSNFPNKCQKYTRKKDDKSFLSETLLFHMEKLSFSYTLNHKQE